MICFNFKFFSLSKYRQFRAFWNKAYKVNKHKFFEIEFYRYRDCLLSLDLDLRWQGHDHAGPNLELGIFGYYTKVSLVDSRHWNYVANDWEKND